MTFTFSSVAQGGVLHFTQTASSVLHDSYCLTQDASHRTWTQMTIIRTSSN